MDNLACGYRDVCCKYRADSSCQYCSDISHDGCKCLLFLTFLQGEVIK